MLAARKILSVRCCSSKYRNNDPNLKPPYNVIPFFVFDMSLWRPLLLELYLLLSVIASSRGAALDLVEFFLGPRIGKSAAELKSRSYVKYTDAEHFIRSNGYPFEAHEVITEDGYILGLHRIPSSKNSKKEDRNNTLNSQRPAVLFQHGLLAASDTWLFRGDELDLPYILADAGYDVWMSNMRGNVYSRRHTKFNPDLDPEYWKFSLHEVGYFDLPATIDHILNVTRQQKLFLMGHSVGSSVMFILGALRPEYNTKIRLHLALAPLIYVLHKITLPQKLMITPVPALTQIAISQNILNVLPRRPYFSKIIELACRDGMSFQQVCLSTIFALVGDDYEMFNSSYFPLVATHYPAGSSIYLTMHTYQIYREGTFRPLDYHDFHENEAKYKTYTPKPYNLSLVTHPISLHYGEGDLLVTEEDINFTMKSLPNIIGKFRVPFKKFNHMDFMWGLRANELLYNKLIVIMDKYR